MWPDRLFDLELAFTGISTRNVAWMFPKIRSAPEINYRDESKADSEGMEERAALPSSHQEKPMAGMKEASAERNTAPQRAKGQEVALNRINRTRRERIFECLI